MESFVTHVFNGAHDNSFTQKNKKKEEEEDDIIILYT